MDTSKNPYVKKIVALVAAHIKSGSERKEATAKLNVEYESLDSSPNRKNEISAELSALKVQGTNAATKHASDINGISDEYAATVNAWGALKSADLSDDVALLSGAIMLTVEDLTALEQRHWDNNTVMRCIGDYAKKNNISWTRRSPTPERKVTAMNEIAKYFSDIRDSGYSAEVFAKHLYGEGVAIANFLAGYDGVVGDGHELAAIKATE